MKKSSSLEKQLRSLKPRPASQGLKSSIFGKETEAEEAFQGFSIQWMAPSLAAFTLAIGLIGSSAPGITSLASNTSTGMVATALTAFHSPHNAWPQRTFEWTNASGSLTTAPSLVINELPQ